MIIEGGQIGGRDGIACLDSKVAELFYSWLTQGAPGDRHAGRDAVLEVEQT